ncbi:hypothetical protein K701_07940 [Streptomyces fradiae ATCC 10745 = DSM 40063]|uniref:AraC family transcriptional regulator n=1 Tax=Streptomyces fradiae ATCC 10745 = DSM 40063 TaxID=1319510 RepID=A0ABQ6XXQ4_STRFR|nr:hypothetical protein K701_07940 [Streptomyces fradiae ATCC 10745 = DSM 40063]
MRPRDRAVRTGRADGADRAGGRAVRRVRTGNGYGR